MGGGELLWYQMLETGNNFCAFYLANSKEQFLQSYSCFSTLSNSITKHFCMEWGTTKTPGIQKCFVSAVPIGNFIISLLPKNKPSMKIIYGFRGIIPGLAIA